MLACAFSIAISTDLTRFGCPLPIPSSFWSFAIVIALLFTCFTHRHANLRSSSCSAVGCFWETVVNSIPSGTSESASWNSQPPAFQYQTALLFRSDKSDSKEWAYISCVSEEKSDPTISVAGICCFASERAILIRTQPESTDLKFDASFDPREPVAWLPGCEESWTCPSAFPAL